jgi:uncharacterized protein YbjT (DUF2867 family)
MHHSLPGRFAALLLLISLSVPAFADTLVFGGTRGVGLETVRQLRESGEAVTVMVRETSDLTALSAIEGVSTTVGDALVMADVTAAFASGTFETVITTLGGTPASYEVDSVGNIHAMDGAIAAGVERFILISSIGTGDSRAAAPASMLKALGMVLAGKEKAERHLIDSGLSFTIIRPGVLLDKTANGRGVLIQDTSASGVISRAEMARVIVAAIGDEQTFGRIYTAVEQKK